MARRAKTVDNAVQALENAYLADIEPPKSVKLRPIDLPIWAALVRARARDEWTDIDLHHAANLTRCLADIERISEELATDGDTLTNDRGTRTVNPKHAILETLSRRGVALTRLLHLHAQALMPDARKQLPAREAERTARATAAALSSGRGDDMEGDGLLATPTRLQ
jgi:hypothetical protein